MTQLENTITANARRELAAVLSYYREKTTGSSSEGAGDEAWLDYLGHYHAMNGLLMLAHQVDSGMSSECVAALLQIEAEHAAAYQS